MVQRIVKRKSSPRRISARPLGFWQFIRKNLLIIAGLLLLPVTVGAVVSSYNYANQSSAAGLSGMNLSIEGRKNKKAPLPTTPPQSRGNTLKTQGYSLCNQFTDPNAYKCIAGSPPTCKTCITDGAGGGDWTGDNCTNNQKRECGIQISIAPRATIAKDPGTNSFNCDVDKCYQSGNVWCKCDKKKDSNDYYSDLVDCMYPSEDSCYGRNSLGRGAPENPTENPNPGGGGGGEPPPGGGRNEDGKICTFCPNGGVCHKCGGGSCSDGSTYNGDDCAPQESCPKRAEDACHLRGPDIKPAGFDVKKAIQNFFGIFGF